MAEEKKKDKEEAPKLVEVYGDEIRVDKTEEDKKDKKEEEKEDKNEKKDNPSTRTSSVQDKKKTPEEIVEEIIEERQAFKTEVVDQEKEEKIVEESSDQDKEDTLLDIRGDKKNKKESRQNMDETAFEEEIGSQRTAVKSVFGVGLFVFLIIFGLTGWAFYLKSVWLPNETVSEVVTEASPAPENTATPIPTPTPLARDEITLDVLNGSGITGLAGETSTTFEELGYVIGKLGNADSVDENELYVKEELLDTLSVLYEDVLEELKISSPSGYLDDNEEADAKIVLGS